MVLPISHPGIQVLRLEESLESYTKHEVECFVCGRKESERDVSGDDFARTLVAAGWVYGESEKFGTIGPLCPGCAKTPDKDRGE